MVVLGVSVAMMGIYGVIVLSQSGMPIADAGRMLRLASALGGTAGMPLKESIAFFAMRYWGILLAAGAFGTVLGWFMKCTGKER